MKRLFISLALALMLVAVMATPVMADNPDTGTTDITGNVVLAIEVTAPSAIGFGDMIIGDNTASSTDGAISSNGASWTLTAADEKGTNTGYMVSGSDVLTTEFEISEDGGTYTGASTGITYTGSPTTFSLYVRQTVTMSDPIASGYSITITFTATAS